jgi:hypothetical protein
MDLSRRVVHLQLVDGSDIEARALRDHLSEAEGMDVALIAGDGPEGYRSRGSAPTSEILLTVTLASTTVKGLVALVQAWMERSSKRKIRLSFQGADEVIEIEGGIGDQEERLLQAWEQRRRP